MAPSGMTVMGLGCPLPSEGVLCDRPGFINVQWFAHAHSPARFRRPRTRIGVENRSVSVGDKTLVRAGQCRDRARGRLRGARCRRPCGGDRFLQSQRGRTGGGRPRNAARRRHRRRSRGRRHQGVRAEQTGGTARGLEGILPRRCAANSGFPLVPMAASTMPAMRWPTSAPMARRSWSRLTALPPARAWWSR